jgi:hypothetical protein
VPTSLGNLSLAKLKNRWENFIKLDPKKRGCEDVSWIKLV